MGAFVNAAPSADELSTMIADKANSIQTLQAEIAKYQKDLKVIGGQKTSLQNELKILDLTTKKLAADIAVTENKISVTNFQLEELSSQINVKSDQLEENIGAIGEALKLINENDANDLVRMILASRSMSNTWDTLETDQRFEDSVRKNIENLKLVKHDLEAQKDQTTKIKNQLTSLQKDLADQKQVADYNTKQKNDLLKATKNNESNYNKILAQKITLRDAFERELLDYESQLHLLIDPKSYPAPLKGILSWPLDNVTVTQLFGNTSFSASHPQVYNGQGHNGVDFRAAIGTPVKAVLEGEVIGTGDTDSICPGASYGKWVLVQHHNGLSSLYAHFSVLRVGKGNHVDTGEILGYSGNTGYTTGPHLHLSLFATQGVEIMEHKSKVCGGTYTMPIADLKAYLNPLSYLPTLN